MKALSVCLVLVLQGAECYFLLFPAYLSWRGGVLYSINHHFTWKGKNCSCLLNRLRFTLGVCFPFILFWLAVYHLCLVEEILRRSYIWGVILVWTVSKILDGWMLPSDSPSTLLVSLKMPSYKWKERDPLPELIVNPQKQTQTSPSPILGKYNISKGISNQKWNAVLHTF